MFQFFFFFREQETETSGRYLVPTVVCIAFATSSPITCENKLNRKIELQKLYTERIFEGNSL